MRFNTALVAGVVLSLFVVSIVAGYIVGEKYFKPGMRPAPVAPATPPAAGLVPPTMPPEPSGLATPRLAPPGPATTPVLPPPVSEATPVPATPRTTPGPDAVESPASTPAPRAAEPVPAGRLFIVQVGAFANRANADALAARLRADGFGAYVVIDGPLFKVRVGAFRDRALADALVERLRAKGYPVTVVH